MLFSLPLFFFSHFLSDLIFVFFCFLLFLKRGSNLFFFIREVFLFDKLSYIVTLLIFWLFSLLFLLANKYQKSLISVLKYKIFCYFLILFLISALLINELLGFYIFFEVSLVPLIIIILGWGYQVERIQASFYLLIYTLVGSLPLLFFFLIIFDKYSLDWLSLFFINNSFNLISFFIILILGLAFFIKLPLYGLHLWLPKAHVEAPVTGSMVLAAVLLKLSLYGFYRCFSIILIRVYLRTFFLVLLYWGAILRRIICFRQTDIKSIIAYSSIRHIGIIIGGFFLFNQLAIKGSFIIIIVHGFCSSSLFYLVNFHYERTFSRQIFNNRGQLVFFKFIGVFWLLLLSVNFSAPPFISLVGEILIFICCLIIDVVFLVILGFVSFIVAGFCIYLFRVLLHGVISKSKIVQLENDINFLNLFFHFIPCLFIVFLLDFFWF